ncbi:MAG: DsbC family protein [Candidatus Thiodiazotropha sp.]
MRDIAGAVATTFLLSIATPSYALTESEYKNHTDAIPADEMIVYASNSKQRHITVFTDIDCGYCRKLHAEVPALNASGVDVRYVAFPRAGIGSDSYKKYVSVYCADEPERALTDAKMGVVLKPVNCANPVEKNFNLGKELEVKGTPMIVVDDGSVISGYMKARKLLRRMKLAYVKPPKGSEMFPKVAANRVSPQHYLVVAKSHLYTRPDTRMQIMGTLEPDVVQKFSLEIDVNGEPWIGFKKGNTQYFTQAKNLQLIPNVKTTSINSKKYAATKATAIYISPHRKARKMADMPVNSYYRFNLEVTNENERWLGFKQGGIKYYVPAADLEAL